MDVKSEERAGRLAAPVEEAYEQYAAEVTGYAAVLAGPAEAAATVVEALIRLDFEDEAHIDRGHLYRAVYGVAHDRHRSSLEGRLAESVEPDTPADLHTLARLSLEERAVLYLCDGVGLDTDSAGRQLGLSPTEAARAHENARQKLDLGPEAGPQGVRAFLGGIVNQAPPPPRPWIRAGRSGPRRNRSPRTITLVTIAAVGALLVPYLFLSNPGPVAAVTTTVSEEPPPGAVTFQGVIYLVHDPTGSTSGFPALVSFEVSAVDETGILAEGDDEVTFLTKMTDLDVTLPSSPSSPETAPTVVFYSMVPAETRIEDVSTVAWRGSNALVMDMNPEFLDGTGSESGDVALLNQLVYTATQQDPSQPVWLTVGDEPIAAFGEGALDISTPLYRDTLRDRLNPILIDEPVTVDLAGQTIDVHGWARTSDGSVSYRVFSSQSGEVSAGTVDVSCGSDCWGEFTFVVPASSMPPEGVLQVFEDVAGAQTNRVDVYMPAGFDGRWDLSP